jgi:hypothetical protein
MIECNFRVLQHAVNSRNLPFFNCPALGMVCRLQYTECVRRMNHVQSSSGERSGSSNTSRPHGRIGRPTCETPPLPHVFPVSCDV